MATDASDLFSTPTVAGLVVAGLSLGAVYAFSYTRLGRILGGAGSEEDYTHTRTRGDASTRSRKGSEDDREKDAVATRSTAAVRKGRKKKGKGVEGGEGEGWGGDEAQVKTGGRRKPGGRGEAKAGVPSVVPFPRVVPGSFEGARADVGSSEALSAEAASAGDKTQKRKRTKKKQKKDKGKDGDEDKGAGSETGREVDVRHTAARPSRSRSGDSTDASPSASGDAQPVAPRPTARGKATSLAPPTSQPHAQPRGIRPSLSFANDTDSSWTHVDRRRLRASKSADGQARSLTDAMDATSSDLASTASDSPVAERMDLDVALDTRGARADSEQRTLAERLVPRPRKTGVDDMLEQPEFPTLARVMRVQPPADETPVPGFSWEDYGDVVEESVLVHDADEEDEGEWGVVKSRYRTQLPQAAITTTTTTVSTSTSHAPAARETMTKRQRQNARKRELVKSAKAEAETARLQRLAKHQRELERLRIIEQSRQGGGKRPSGGMQATVDDRGKLVWE